MEWIMKIMASVYAIFRRPEAKSQPQRPVRAARKSRDEQFGAHYYLTDLLDQLERCFGDMQAFKKASPEAFKLYHSVGASVSSKDILFATDTQPWVLGRSLPAFACCFFGGYDCKDDRVSPSFIYYQKIDRPINVQPSNLPTFNIGFIYKLKGTKHSVCCEIPISVADDGSCRALKRLDVKTFSVGRGSKRAIFTRGVWNYGDVDDILLKDGKTRDENATSIFNIITNSYYSSEAGMTVRVKSPSGDVAVFSIDMLRTPYFFADREKTTTENGHTKKIIHHVRGHWRNTGPIAKFIRPHFRGLRKFVWNGYFVTVGMAGWHNKAISQFTFAAFDDARETTDVIGADMTGAMIDKAMNSDSGGYNARH